MDQFSGVSKQIPNHESMPHLTLTFFRLARGQEREGARDARRHGIEGVHQSHWRFKDPACGRALPTGSRHGATGQQGDILLAMPSVPETFDNIRTGDGFDYVSEESPCMAAEDEALVPSPPVKNKTKKDTGPVTPPYPWHEPRLPSHQTRQMPPTKQMPAGNPTEPLPSRRGRQRTSGEAGLPMETEESVPSAGE